MVGLLFYSYCVGGIEVLASGQPAGDDDIDGSIVFGDAAKIEEKVPRQNALVLVGTKA